MFISDQDIPRPIKWKDNKLTFGPRISVNHRFTNGFVDGDRYTSAAYSVTPGINLTYEIKDKMTIKPSYSLSYNQTDYKTMYWINHFSKQCFQPAVYQLFRKESGFYNRE